MSGTVVFEFSGSVDATRIVSTEGGVVGFEVLASGPGVIDGHDVLIVANRVLKRFDDGTATTNCRIVATAQEGFDTVILTGSSAGARNKDGSYSIRGSMTGKGAGNTFGGLNGKGLHAEG